MRFKVTRIHRIDGEGNLKAFADIAIDDALLMKGLRVVQGRVGLFVSMPREKGRDNRWYETIHPMSKEVKEAITKVVLRVYGGSDDGTKISDNNQATEETPTRQGNRRGRSNY